VVLIVGHASTAVKAVCLIFAIAWGLVCLAGYVYITLLERFASRHLVLGNTGITEALRTGHHLIARRLGTSLVMWLINLVIAIGVSLVLLIPVVLILLLLVGLGFAVWALAKMTGVWIYAVVMGCAFFALMWVIDGIFVAFVSSYWTLCFRALEYVVLKQPAGPGLGPSIETAKAV
jgi:hypothetical protein